MPLHLNLTYWGSGISFEAYFPRYWGLIIINQRLLLHFDPIVIQNWAFVIWITLTEALDWQMMNQNLDLCPHSIGPCLVDVSIIDYVGSGRSYFHQCWTSQALSLMMIPFRDFHVSDLGLSNEMDRRALRVRTLTDGSLALIVLHSWISA